MRTRTKLEDKTQENVAVEEEKQARQDNLGKSQKEASTGSDEKHLHLNKRKFMKNKKESNPNP